ncbi:FAD-dependent thymidylate synthase [Nakamurella deserti]|uniref:FAD-dependent thymidylate synthase n=1 Tax=Nakamurella deserti TaxID=2164074 RepID=UPI000DBE1DE7|nr:FAD-dependent thymidylate synthase [Nakamurella deserti]
MLRVQLVGATSFSPPADVPWDTDADGGQALAEFAGRACYQSWSKPVASTATNAGYLRHILQVGHLSVLEHASATFYVTGVSRALAHELIRHRHLSVSELSQRHHPAEDVVVPTAIERDPELRELFLTSTAAAREAYTTVLTALEAKVETAPAGTLNRKQARQAARSVLTHATPTVLVVTGNLRAWRHFVGMRASDAADTEIRALAVTVLRELLQVAPHAFTDFRISQLPDGSETAASPLIGEG